MIHFSLFSGIGGFEIAAEAMGWKNFLSCDINEFGNRVREYYWPDAYHHKNIKDLNYETIHAELSKRFGSEWRSEDIILTGGFPCQPYSVAGKQLGTEDDRHLWPEMLRIISEVQPRWIVGENVRGLINWGGGLVFDQVQADLEAKGYEILPFLLPACAIDAPHRRDRIWFIAFNSKCSTTRRYDSGEGSGKGMEMDGDFMDQTRRNEGANEFKSSSSDDTNGTNSRVESLQREEVDTNKFDAITDARCDGERAGTGKNIRSEGIQSKQQNLNDMGIERSDASFSFGERCDDGSDNREERHIQGNLGIAEENQSERDGRKCGTCEISSIDAGIITDTNKVGFQCTRESTRLGGQRFSECYSQKNKSTWENFPTQSPICSRDDELPGRLDGITFPKWRQRIHQSIRKRSSPGVGSSNI
jgi:DNA (cytosine-5)-methyltransferase 1